MPQSLQCPRCNGSVRVPDKAAGRRVKCPHCQGTFLAPGIDLTKHDNEEDWLSLDEPTRTVERKYLESVGRSPQFNCRLNKTYWVMIL